MGRSKEEKQTNRLTHCRLTDGKTKGRQAERKTDAVSHSKIKRNKKEGERSRQTDKQTYGSKSKDTIVHKI